jgi:hypothetical protein
MMAALLTGHSVAVPPPSGETHCYAKPLAQLGAFRSNAPGNGHTAPRASPKVDLVTRPAHLANCLGRR